MQPHDEPEDTRGSNVTAVSLRNNAALPLLMAGMSYRTASWLECLQDTGTLLRRPVRPFAPWAWRSKLWLCV